MILFHVQGYYVAIAFLTSLIAYIQYSRSSLYSSSLSSRGYHTWVHVSSLMSVVCSTQNHSCLIKGMTIATHHVFMTIFRGAGAKKLIWPTTLFADHTHFPVILNSFVSMRFYWGKCPSCPNGSYSSGIGLAWHTWVDVRIQTSTLVSCS